MPAEANRAIKAAHRAMWALGDYHRFATSTVWELGPILVEACGVRAGQQVLDVAAGTGNVAIRAARTGAIVVASDLTPEHFEAWRRAAHDEGVSVEWVEADAEALPFDATASTSSPRHSARCSRRTTRLVVARKRAA
jgi:2-polyprenyl-3-methyl-5-hydroxy-6-metoxy-1,4-benzoquinol methylase